MLLSKTVMTKWNSRTVKYYVNKGYTYNKGDIGKELEIKVEDLKPFSETLVKIQCDYNEEGCENIINKKYCEYLDSHKITNKDCCNNPKCKQRKLEESINKKYGVNNISKSDYFKDKYKDIMQEKYGVDNYFLLSPFVGKNNYEFKDTNIICNNCGKKIHRKESHIRINGLNFCNMKCKKEYTKKVSPVPEYLRIRKSTEYAIWRRNVIDRDHKTCQCCGKTGGRLEVHHIENFLNNVDLRFSVDNGITLCEDCHNAKKYGSFHNIYGTKDNNKKQLEEYMKRYKNGEFDEIKKLNIKYEIPKTKICPQCKINLPNTLEYYGKDKYSKDGLTCTCKKCRQKYYYKRKKLKEVS